MSTLSLSAPCRSCHRELHNVHLKPGLDSRLHCPYCGVAAPKSPAVALVLADTRTLPFWCSVTGDPFEIVYSRLNESQRYRAVEQVRGLGVNDRRAFDLAPQSGIGVRALDRHTAFALHEFDFSDWSCMWCSTRRGRFICGECGMSSCLGAAEFINGRTWFRCPGCAWEGFTVGGAPRIAGDAATFAYRQPAAALPLATRSSLPAPSGMRDRLHRLLITAKGGQR